MGCNRTYMEQDAFLLLLPRNIFMLSKGCPATQHIIRQRTHTPTVQLQGQQAVVQSLLDLEESVDGYFTD
jgi:hypothetical protein